MGWLILILIFLILLVILLARVLGDSNNTGPSEPISMTTPYVNEADMVSINEAYSETAACPWGFIHQGIDFFPALNTLHEFQAVADGVVENIDLFQNSGNGFWQVNVSIRYNNSFTVEYAFEPMSSVHADGQTQFDNIVVSEQASVVSGQLIGRLHAVSNGAHLHFSLTENGQFICPEPYFTPVAHASIMVLLINTFPSEPNLQMCYL